MKIKSQKIWIIFAILTAILLCVGTVFYYIHKNSIESQLHRMESLNTAVTFMQLDKAGYINVTGIKTAEEPKITRFLTNAKARRAATIRTYFIQQGNLFVELYVYDPSLNLIRSWTYEPWKQAGDDPDKRFSINYKTIVKDGNSSIQLINVKNDSIPVSQTLKDEILYTYRSLN